MIFGILLLGFIAPFLIVFGPVVYLLAVPMIGLAKFGYPYWLRISKPNRKLIIHTMIWSASAFVWVSLIRSTG